MSAEKGIVIQHTDGKFYAFFVNDESEQWVIDLFKYPNHILSPNIEETTNLDFPIGSRVYFQGIGWTEVVGMSGCEICAFSNIGEDENIECPKVECSCRQFKKLELLSSQFYVLNTKTSHTSVIHTTEESARNEAERLSKKQIGDVFKVLKVVASCQSEAVTKWN